jgi:DNA-binding transcriptional LysR family regulator
MGLARANSYQIVDHVRRGALALTLEAFEPPARPVNLIYNGHARLPLKLRAFIDFVTPRLRARLKAAALSPQSGNESQTHARVRLSSIIP